MFLFLQLHLLIKKYRQIQVLEILNDQVCNKLMAPYQGRIPSEGMGQNATLEAGYLA